MQPGSQCLNTFPIRKVGQYLVQMPCIMHAGNCPGDMCRVPQRQYSMSLRGHFAGGISLLDSLLAKSLLYAPCAVGQLALSDAEESLSNNATSGHKLDMTIACTEAATQSPQSLSCGFSRSGRIKGRMVGKDTRRKALHWATSVLAETMACTRVQDEQTRL